MPSSRIAPFPSISPGTVAKAEALTEKAAATGARLIVFPEAFVSGYPKGLDFGARVGCAARKGATCSAAITTLRSNSIPRNAGVSAPPRAKPRRMSRSASWRRTAARFIARVLFFGPDGTLLGKHRKLMPTAMERLIWGFGDGSTLTVLDTPFGKLGAVICWENYMPLLRTAMYAKGVQIYCAPTADDRDTWVSTMQHVALEGRCFVLSACQYLTRGDCPDDYDAIQGADPKTVLMRGGSCIVSPLGQVLAGPHFNGPTILTADLDLDDIARGKFDFDVTGHYARPDVFRLHVNERAMTPVSNSIGAPADPFAD